MAVLLRVGCTEGKAPERPQPLSRSLPLTLSLVAVNGERHARGALDMCPIPTFHKKFNLF